MVTQRKELWRATNLAVLTAVLVAIVLALGVLFYALGSVDWTVVDPAVRRRYLAGMAFILGVLLIFALVGIALLMIRYLSSRLKLQQSSHPPTEYVDAWQLAGQRFKMPDEPATGDDDTDDADDEL